MIVMSRTAEWFTDTLMKVTARTQRGIIARFVEFPEELLEQSEEFRQGLLNLMTRRVVVFEADWIY